MLIAVCDDEQVYRNKVRNYVKKYLEQNHLVAAIEVFSTGKELCQFKQLEQVDILFLNIEMEGGNGLEIGYIISKKNPAVLIIYISNHIEYCLQSYEVERTFRYLLKNTLNDTLPKSMDAAMRRLNIYNKEIYFPFINGERKIFQNEILYVESEKHKVFFRFADKKKEVKFLYSKLDEIENRLDERLFVRIHKSFLANMYYIKTLDTEIEFYNGIRLPISQRKAADVKRKYYTYRGKL